MKSRKITVIETKNQKKSVIMSSATTLEELKADFRANGINYTDMSFFEGISKIELKTDSSILPHDVPYKGTITNELVFMLTNTNKKIKSGAELSRNKLYSIIKLKNLQKECKEKFGKNFTRCSNAELTLLVEPSVVSKSMNQTNNNSSPNSSGDAAKLTDDDKMSKLVKLLIDKNIISQNEWNNTLEGKDLNKENSSSYSDIELDNMFSEMNLTD